MTNLDSVLKSRDIILPTKIHIAKAMVSPVVMYGYSWIIKKAERWGIGAFELWHWRRLLRVPWTAKRWNTVNPKGNQPWIFTGKTDAKTEAPILFLATWYEDPIHSLEKTLMLGDWGQEAKGVTEDKTAEWHHQLNGHESNQAPGDDEGQGSLLCCSPWHHRVGQGWAIKQQELSTYYEPDTSISKINKTNTLLAFRELAVWRGRCTINQAIRV